MNFSIIIPSFNQGNYIRQTLKNVTDLKTNAAEQGIGIEILLFDNESNAEVQNIINDFAPLLDVVEVKKDKGQYDAINKGIERCRGEYWTWLNTDDFIETEGFLKLAKCVMADPSIDYIFGSTIYMDGDGKYLFTNMSRPLRYDDLVHRRPGIFQPGSFFKSSFTKKIGVLAPFRCCFDYEYILRCLKNGAVFYCCNFSVASFRYYTDSKTGMIMSVFIKEQLQISKQYGRTVFDFLTWFSYLRLLKHRLLS